MAIERRPHAVVLNLSFSRVDEVAHAIEQLAKKHGLDVYDPQARKLIRATESAAGSRASRGATATPTPTPNTRSATPRASTNR